MRGKIQTSPAHVGRAERSESISALPGFCGSIGLWVAIESELKEV